LTWLRGKNYVHCDDLFGLAVRGWIATHSYGHTYSKGKLGLYIKYIYTVKSASGAGSSKVNTV